MPFEPKPFGKYFLTDKLAIGGMAEIYKAKTFGVDGFEKQLAIKKILPHLSADKEFIAMLTDEAKLVVRLSHTNIVQIYDLGKVGDDYYISMEFIDGINLRELINRGKEIGETIPVPICLYIMSEICKGLDYAHIKRDENNKPLNIVHRDISPQNVLISYEGESKIVDFGIAKAAMNISQTMAGMLKGKITYMSPEQALGKPVDQRTDIFSAGIILYELLTGNRLFSGETQFEVLKKIRTTHITEANLSKKVPKELRPLLAKALAYNPNDRYETAGDFQIELTKMLYSRYVDFSPKQLANLIRKLFAPELKVKRKKAQEETFIDSNTKSFLLEMSQQESIVHREEKEKEEKEKIHPDFQDTTKPEDFIRPSLLKHGFDKQPVSVAAEATAKEKGLLKRKGFYLPALFLLLVAVSVGIYFTYFHEPKPKPQPELGQIDITSEPSGAKIFINGKDTAKTTPALIEDLMLNEDLNVKLVKEGFQPWEKEMTLQDANPLPLDATLEAIPLGTIEIVSKPEGAQIFIDGKDTAKTTPAKIEELATQKTYQIKLTKDGFQPLEEKVEIKNADLFTVNWTLKEIVFGTLKISSQPKGAAIHLNGKDLGKVTPATIEQLEIPKNYQIQLSKKGFKEASRSIEINSKEPVSLDLELQVLMGKLQIDSNVTGATVYFNGKRVGLSSGSFEVEPGSIKVKLTKKGYKKVEKRVTVNAGESKKLQLSMIKESVTTPPPIKQPPSTGGPLARVRIDSSPRGASVVIDGRKAGVTPVLIRNLSKNQTHSVTVSLPGYRRWSRSFKPSRDYLEFMANLQKE